MCFFPSPKIACGILWPPLGSQSGDVDHASAREKAMYGLSALVESLRMVFLAVDGADGQRKRSSQPDDQMFFFRFAQLLGAKASSL